MYLCQWHLDVPYGRQADAVRILTAWGRAKREHSGFRKATACRLLAGHVGASPSHLIDEYVFESLADFEAALADMAQERFRPHSEALAPLVVPGTQAWRIYRCIS
jgi:riboflavin synthase